MIDSAQDPALGAAMHAAVAAGAYPDIRAAARTMGKARPAVYLPDPERAEAYERPYIICEAVADSALHTLSLNPTAAPPAHLLERHYTRKHGPGALYGNPDMATST